MTEAFNQSPKIIIGAATLYLGDSQQLPSFHADAVITDPMYYNNYDVTKKRSRQTSLKRLDKNIEADWKSLKTFQLNCSKWIEYEKVIIWGGNYFSNKLPISSCWLIWDKKHYTTSDNQGDCELAWTNLNGPIRRKFHLWRGLVRSGRENCRHSKKIHPFQKPVSLIEWCIEQCNLPKGSIIYDPFMGSGTTGVAAIKNGYRFIGTEIDGEIFNKAALRLRKEQNQLSLLSF